MVAMARTRQSAEKAAALGAKAVPCSLLTVKPDDLSDCDAVIHTAAFVSPTGSRQQFWQTNVEGTRRLLAAATLADVPRFVHISTEAVLFCGQDMVNIDESYPYPKNTPYLYPETKAEAERLVLAANDPLNGFTTIALRPRLVWGPGDQTILPTLTQMARDGGFFWFDHGRSLTSTTHITNLIHAVQLALIAAANGQSYFITDDEIRTIKEFLTALAATQNITLPDRSLPSRPMKYVGRFLGGLWSLLNLKSRPLLTEYAVVAMSADCTLVIDKAKNELGYKPLISVAQGLEMMKQL